MKQPITACLIVRNEEQNLPKCLDSIKDWVSEIVIVDTGSSDNTKKIAKKYTKKVFDYDMKKHFANGRNYANSKATQKWIFTIDADEVLETPIEIPEGYNFFFANIVNTENGQKSISRSVRLFERKCGLRYHYAKHEQFLKEDLEKLKGIGINNFKIIHKEKSREEYVRKAESLLKEHFKQLKTEPYNPYLKGQIGYCYYVLGEYQTAIDFMTLALFSNTPLQPKAQLCINLFKCFDELGKSQIAREYLDMSIIFCPEQLSARAVMYDILKNDGQLEEAQKQKEAIMRVGYNSQLPFDLDFSTLQLN